MYFDKAIYRQSETCTTIRKNHKKGFTLIRVRSDQYYTVTLPIVIFTAITGTNVMYVRSSRTVKDTVFAQVIKLEENERNRSVFQPHYGQVVGLLH